MKYLRQNIYAHKMKKRAIRAGQPKKLVVVMLKIWLPNLRGEVSRSNCTKRRWERLREGLRKDCCQWGLETLVRETHIKSQIECWAWVVESMNYLREKPKTKRQLKSKDSKSLSVWKKYIYLKSIKPSGCWIFINVIQAIRSRDWLFEFWYIFISRSIGQTEEPTKF